MRPNLKFKLLIKYNRIIFILNIKARLRILAYNTKQKKVIQKYHINE